MMHLLYELEFLREGIDQHIGVRVVEDTFPHVLQQQPQVVHYSDEVNWVATWFHGTGVFRVAVETLLQGDPGGSPVAHATQFIAHVRPHGDVR